MILRIGIYDEIMIIDTSEIMQDYRLHICNVILDGFETTLDKYCIMVENNGDLYKALLLLSDKYNLYLA